MSSTRDKIIGYLAAGVSQSIAAESAGVTESYVSQLLLEDGVREEIASKKSAKLERHIEVDETIETAEKLALQRMVGRLQSPLTPLREATQAFSVLNAARKKADPGVVGNQAGMVDSVTITLPKAAKVMIQVNTDNQVIDVDGRTTAPLPSKALPTLVRELAAPKTVELPHITEVREKTRVADVARAQSILKDVTTVINGVPVVI